MCSLPPPRALCLPNRLPPLIWRQGSSHSDSVKCGNLDCHLVRRIAEWADRWMEESSWKEGGRGGSGREWRSREDFIAPKKDPPRPFQRLHCSPQDQHAAWLVRPEAAPCRHHSPLRCIRSSGARPFFPPELCLTIGILLLRALLPLCSSGESDNFSLKTEYAPLQKPAKGQTG